LNIQGEVKQAQVSGNLDAPEGGFDAIMQAIVCHEQVNITKVKNIAQLTVHLILCELPFALYRLLPHLRRNYQSFYRLDGVTRQEGFWFSLLMLAFIMLEMVNWEALSSQMMESVILTVKVSILTLLC